MESVNDDKSERLRDDTPGELSTDVSADGPSLNSKGALQIRTVSERTGLASATLRAWERRYGVPRPARSNAKYRLYDETDVAIILRMMELCDSGIRPSEAARRAMIEAKRTLREQQDVPSLLDELIEASRAMSPNRMHDVLERAFADCPAGQAFERVVVPFFEQLEQDVRLGNQTAAHMYAAAAAVRCYLVTFLCKQPECSGAKRAILACFEGETHDLGLFGFAFHVRELGFEPLVFGPVSPQLLSEAIEQAKPSFVAFGIMMPITAKRVRSLLDAYQKACTAVPWIVGGQGVVPLVDAIRRRGGTVVLGSSYDSDVLEKFVE